MGGEIREKLEEEIKKVMMKEMDENMKEKITRRAKGCKQPKCYANKKNWEEKKKTLCYKDIFELE